MKKEQFTIRTLPIVRLALEKSLLKTSHKNLNDYINSVLESHLYKINQEENITNSINEKLAQIDEKNERDIREIQTAINVNKQILAKILKEIIG